jgi:hypothetical protein
MIWDVHPESRIPDPDPDFFHPRSRIQIPESGVKKHRLSDPGSGSANCFLIPSSRSLLLFCCCCLIPSAYSLTLYTFFSLRILHFLITSYQAIHAAGSIFPYTNHATFSLPSTPGMLPFPIACTFNLFPTQSSLLIFSHLSHSISPDRACISPISFLIHLSYPFFPSHS